jgi:hypothetical protein
MSEWPLTKSQSGLKISLFSVKFAKDISFSMQCFSMDVHWIKTIISYNIDLMSSYIQFSFNLRKTSSHSI